MDNWFLCVYHKGLTYKLLNSSFSVFPKSKIYQRVTTPTTAPTTTPQTISNPNFPAADFAVADGLGDPFAPPETVLVPEFVPLAFLVGPL